MLAGGAGVSALGGVWASGGESDAEGGEGMVAEQEVRGYARGCSWYQPATSGTRRLCVVLGAMLFEPGPPATSKPGEHKTKLPNLPCHTRHLCTLQEEVMGGWDQELFEDLMGEYDEEGDGDAAAEFDDFDSPAADY